MLSKVLNTLACGMISLLGVADAFAADAPAAKDCDKVLEHGECVKMVDGKIYVDGKEQKGGFIHTERVGAKRQRLPEAPAGVQRISTTFNKDQLKQVMQHGPMALALPQMYLVDLQTGRVASPDDLPKPLADFFKKHGNPQETIFDAKSSDLLSQILGSLKHDDGRELRKEEFAGKRFVAFQLWAGFCVPCMAEAKELGALLAQQTEQPLAWVALETDPSTLRSPGGPNGNGFIELPDGQMPDRMLMGSAPPAAPAPTQH